MFSASQRIIFVLNTIKINKNLNNNDKPVIYLIDAQYNETCLSESLMLDNFSKIKQQWKYPNIAKFCISYLT